MFLLDNLELSFIHLASLQTGDIADEADIRNFFQSAFLEKGLSIGSGVNRKLHTYKFEIDKILLDKQDILEMAKIGTYYDDSIESKRKEDIVSKSVEENSIVVNFNMNPYEIMDVRRPNFISLVLKFVDTLDMNRYLDFNENAEFKFVLTNFTNSLKKIFVEFKYSDNIRILETYEFQLECGENEIGILLKEMRSKALSNISEICFVIHPDDVGEDEGMFKIKNVEII